MRLKVEFIQAIIRDTKIIASLAKKAEETHDTEKYREPENALRDKLDYFNRLTRGIKVDDA